MGAGANKGGAVMLVARVRVKRTIPSNTGMELAAAELLRPTTVANAAEQSGRKCERFERRMSWRGGFLREPYVRGPARSQRE
jgi:hypothetical protein